MRDGDSLRIVEGGCIYRTEGAVNETHRSHALQLVVPAEGVVQATVDGVEIALPSGKAMLISPDVPRQVRAGAPRIALLFDPESLGAAFRSFSRSANMTVLAGPVGKQLQRLALEIHDASLLSGAAVEAALHEGRRILDQAGLTRPCAIDSRVRSALELYRRPWLQLDHLSIARRSGISPDHLSHLFKDQIGISAKRYALWVRTVIGIERMCHGGSATQAAKDVRFSDAAHFSRACKQHFGHSPSKLPTQTSYVFEAESLERSCDGWSVALAERLDAVSAAP